jgi:hypothetical protein
MSNLSNICTGVELFTGVNNTGGHPKDEIGYIDRRRVCS